MMKTKETSNKSGAFAKGGSNKMFGKMGVNTMEAGVAAPTRAPSANNAAPKGGRTGVMGKQGGVMPSAPGVASTYGAGNNTFKVSGGKARMAPFTGSTTAKCC